MHLTNRNNSTNSPLTLAPFLLPRPLGERIDGAKRAIEVRGLKRSPQSAQSRHRSVLLFLASSFLTLAGIASAGEPKTEPLWPNGAPGAKGTEDKDKPTITVYLPEKQTNPTAAVVICPGADRQPFKRVAGHG